MWFSISRSALCREYREEYRQLGIGELVSAFAAAKKHGDEFKLLNLTKDIHDLLQITKLYTVLDVRDDEAPAVESFST
jgi:anti-sigma B factor antagonist